jgi:hypothetical protein
MPGFWVGCGVMRGCAANTKDLLRQQVRCAIYDLPPAEVSQCSAALPAYARFCIRPIDGYPHRGGGELVTPSSTMLPCSPCSATQHHAAHVPWWASSPLAQAAQANYTIMINTYLCSTKTTTLRVGMPSAGEGESSVQVTVPPLSGHAHHAVQAPGARRMAPAHHPPVSLSLRSVRLSVQALQPPRALRPVGYPFPTLVWRICRLYPCSIQITEPLDSPFAPGDTRVGG